MATTPQRRAGYLLAALVLAAGIAYGLRPAPVQVELATVERGPIRVGFTEEGRTRVRERYLLSAPVAGTLERVRLEVGDPVVPGQVVLRLWPAEGALLDRASRARIAAEIAAATAELSAARDRARAAEAEARQRAEDAARARELRAQGLIAAADAERSATVARQAEAERRAAAALVDGAGARLAALKALLDRGTGAAQEAVIELRAPIAGVVLRRLIESEAPVAQGQALLELGDPSTLELEIEVLSADAVRLTPGTRIDVQRWGGAAALTARVIRVEPIGTTKVSALGVEEQRVRVRAEFTSASELWQRLGDGYRVEAEFVLVERDAVLRIPRAALVRAGGGWMVYRAQGRRVERVPVTIGLEATSYAEVLGGLEPGQQVVIHPDDRVNDGDRIQAVAR